MGRSLCKKNYLLEKDNEAIQLLNKIPDDKNPKQSFSKNDIRMLSNWFIPPSSMTHWNSKNKPLQTTWTLL